MRRQVRSDRYFLSLRMGSRQCSWLKVSSAGNRDSGGSFRRSTGREPAITLDGVIIQAAKLLCGIFHQFREALADLRHGGQCEFGPDPVPDVIADGWPVEGHCGLVPVGDRL